MSTSTSDKPPSRNPQVTTVAFDPLIAIAAFRYALGRMSYAVEHVGIWLIANREKLPSHKRALIVRAIRDADSLNAIGMNIDRRSWMRVSLAPSAGADPDAPASSAEPSLAETVRRLRMWPATEGDGDGFDSAGVRRLMAEATNAIEATTRARDLASDPEFSE